MHVIIRPFQLGDEVGIAHAHERSIKEISSRDYTPEQIAAWTTNMSPRRYLDSIAKNGERFWVIDDAGTIGGFAGWYASHIWVFYMHPEYAGKGLGARLFRAVEEEYWRESGESECFIDSSITAKPFYEKMGFQPLKPAVHKMQDGTPVDIWLMSKQKP